MTTTSLRSLRSEASVVRETYVLEHLSFVGGTGGVPMATVKLRKGKDVLLKASTGDGPVDAVLRAIDLITGKRGKLLDYQLRATTSGKDAVGEVTLKAVFSGSDPIVGRGASTDVVEASAKAYLNAVNRALTTGKRGKSVRGV